MNGSKGFRPGKALARMATLLGAMVTIMLLPAFGQQEVDPTWYDPWGTPNTAVVQASQTRATGHQHQAKVKSVSTVQVAAKTHGKRSAARPKAS